jgi:hypothetical protein
LNPDLAKGGRIVPVGAVQKPFYQRSPLGPFSSAPRLERASPVLIAGSDRLLEIHPNSQHRLEKPVGKPSVIGRRGPSAKAQQNLRSFDVIPNQIGGSVETSQLIGPRSRRHRIRRSIRMTPRGRSEELSLDVGKIDGEPRLDAEELERTLAHVRGKATATCGDGIEEPEAHDPD